MHETIKTKTTNLLSIDFQNNTKAKSTYACGLPKDFYK